MKHQNPRFIRREAAPSNFRYRYQKANTAKKRYQMLKSLFKKSDFNYGN